MDLIYSLKGATVTWEEMLLKKLRIQTVRWIGAHFDVCMSLESRDKSLNKIQLWILKNFRWFCSQILLTYIYQHISFIADFSTNECRLLFRIAQKVSWLRWIVMYKIIVSEFCKL